MPAADVSYETSEQLVDIFENTRQEAEAKLAQLAANPRYAGLTIIPTIASNLDSLIPNIHEQPADLIVLASNGASGGKECLKESYAELIVRHALCPVLVVKEPVGHFQPKKILYAIDVDDKLKLSQPEPFTFIDQGSHQFVYVLTPTDDRQSESIRRWMDDYARVKRIGNYDLAIWRAPTVPEGILDCADATKADLVVLYTHGHTGLRHWIQGSVAEDVVNQTQVPVLIMRT